MPPEALTKAATRERMLARRDLVSLALAEQKARAIGELILDQVKLHGIVAGYHATRREADPSPLLEQLHDRKYALALPVALPGKELAFRRWQPGDALHVGRFGIHEPPEAAPVVMPDMLLIPLVAFDLVGHRLGYGAGFYDRLLARPDYERCRRIGLAYDFQQVERLPSEAHDVTLDIVVTESRVLRFDA